MQVTGPTFSRIFNHPGSGYAEKLKHTIEPYFNVERVSPIDDFDHYVQLDGIDTSSGASTRSATASPTAFSGSQAAGGRSQEMLTASLGQSYYTRRNAPRIYDQSYQTANGTAPSHFSPLSCGPGDADRPDHRAVPRRVRHAVPRRSARCRPTAR